MNNLSQQLYAATKHFGNVQAQHKKEINFDFLILMIFMILRWFFVENDRESWSFGFYWCGEKTRLYFRNWQSFLAFYLSTFKRAFKFSVWMFDILCASWEISIKYILYFIEHLEYFRNMWKTRSFEPLRQSPEASVALD